jgi:hypothetical protein
VKIRLRWKNIISLILCAIFTIAPGISFLNGTLKTVPPFNPLIAFLILLGYFLLFCLPVCLLVDYDKPIESKKEKMYEEDKKERCIYRYGTGEKDCPYCYGRGYNMRLYGFPLINHYETCVYCNGSGKMKSIYRRMD